MTKQFKTVNQDGSYVLREFYLKKKNRVFPERSGIKYEQAYNADGRPHGEGLSFFEDGRVSEKFSYFNGKPHGTWTQYSKLTGKPKSSDNYLYGDLDGVSCEYYEDEACTLKKSALYAGHELNGDYSEYYSNGRIHKQAHYKDSELHGDVKEYSYEGNLIEYTQYYEGAVHGRKIRYSADGKRIISDENYTKDNLNGECVYYYGKDRPKEIRHYKNGVENGLRISFDEKKGNKTLLFVLNGQKITMEQAGEIYRTMCNADNPDRKLPSGIPLSAKGFTISD